MIHSVSNSKPLLTLMRECCEHGVLVTPQTLDQLDADKGAYLVLITIKHPFQLGIRSLPAVHFKPGTYVYCGSAHGPGGIKSRLKRHFAPDKRLHWHVDYLTLRASHLQAIAVTGGKECELTARLQQTGQFTFPVPGFGASDCSSCESHLLQWQEQKEPSPTV